MHIRVDLAASSKAIPSTTPTTAETLFDEILSVLHIDNTATEDVEAIAAAKRET